MGRTLNSRPAQCPVTDEAAMCLTRLPLFYDLTPEACSRVVDAVTAGAI